MLRPDRHAPPTRHACPQSHKGDRVDAVFKIDEAAEVAGHVAYNGGVAADKQNADYKGWVAAPDSCKSTARQSISKSKTINWRNERTKTHFDGGFPGAALAAEALAFVRRQKTLCWSKHHLSQTFRLSRLLHSF